MSYDLSAPNAAAATFAANSSLYFLEIPQERCVLFRIDGVIIEVSRALYDFFETHDEVPVEERLSRLEAQYGRETAADAAEAIASLFEQRLLIAEAPPLKNPQPGKAQPSGILIMMTQTCNVACTYCYAGGGTYGGKTKLMSEGGALRAIDLMLKRAPQRKEFTVTFFGGEPLLNFRLVRRVAEHCDQLAVEKGVTFKHSMTTNGTIVTDEIVQFLQERKFDLMISFDGESGKDNRPFVDGSSSNEMVTSNLQRLSAAGVRFQIRATITRDMVKRETIQELSRFGKSIGREVIMSPASATRNSVLPDTSGLALTEIESAKLAELYRETTECNLASVEEGSGEQTAFDGNRRLVQALIVGKARGMGKCGACMGMAAVSTDGNIYPCHRFVGMADYAIGDLANGVSDDKVSSFFDRAEAANKPNCEVCFARQICGGFCFYTLADGEGGFAPPDARDCDRFRDGVRYAIGTVLRLRDLPASHVRRYVGAAGPTAG